MTAKSADSLKLEVLIKHKALLITMAWIIIIIHYFDIFLWSNILNFALDINILMLPRNKKVWEKCWCGGWGMLHQAFFSFLSCLLYVVLESWEVWGGMHSLNCPEPLVLQITTSLKLSFFKGSESFFSQMLLSKFISPFLLCWFYTKENIRGCVFPLWKCKYIII